VNNLSANTTYYFVVRSEDNAGNASLSSVASFTTREVVQDAKAPVITRLSLVSGVSDMWVSFITDEPSTAKVYYGTTSSIGSNLGGALFKEDTQLATRHSVRISNLNANTLYYLVVQLKDSSGNVNTGDALTLRTAANI
jgi:hypothetical protein